MHRTNVWYNHVGFKPGDIVTGMSRSALVALLLSSALPLCAQTGAATVLSPDGKLELTLETIGSDKAPGPGQLIYRVAVDGKPLIEPSKLQLDLQGAPALGSQVRIIRQTPSSGEDNYRLAAGKSGDVKARFNALRVDAASTTGNGQLSVEVRTFDDGIAFRYDVPKQPGLAQYALTGEGTEFRLSKDAVTYAQLLPNFRSSYEAEYLKLNASAFAGKVGLSQSTLIGLPLLMNVPGVAWLAITEADLRGNSAMYLNNPGKGWGDHIFDARLSPGENGAPAIQASLPHHSAWRVLQIGKEPGRLIESNILTSLNPKSEVQDTSWIHPGLTAWDWWSGSLNAEGKSSFSTETMKYYVDFAAQSDFPYMLVDAGWAAKGDITHMNGKVDIPALVQYARAKNVKVWIWMHHDDVERQMDQAFPLFAQWGVAGLKIDFIERDDQRGIDFYYKTADLAARNHLMVDYHGATKPWGLERTYPNVLGYEAVLGLEQSKAGARDNPDHRTMLPFTRMLAGPMDYTPGGFRNVREEEFVPGAKPPMVLGTRAQQLAMYAIYYAPFQMVSDTPKSYQDQPAFEFIHHAPAAWDETRVLHGRPGEFITMARRSGNEWWLGSLTNWTARELDLDLSFLKPGQRYRAEIYADSPDADRYPTGVAVTRQQVDSSSHVKAKLVSGGGFAARFIPE